MATAKIVTHTHSHTSDPGVTRSYKTGMMHQNATAHSTFHPQLGNRTSLHKGINPLHSNSGGVNTVPRGKSFDTPTGLHIKTDR